MKKVKGLRLMLILCLMLLIMVFNSSNIVFAEMGKKDENNKEINLNDYIEDMRMFEGDFEQIQFYNIKNDSIIFCIKKKTYVERINNGENEKNIKKHAFAIKSKGIKKISIEHPDGSKLEASIGDWEKGILIPKISHDNGYFYRYWEPFKFIFELDSGEKIEKIAKFVLNVPINLEEYGKDKFIKERGNSSENKSTMRVGLSYEVFGDIEKFSDIEKLSKYGKEIFKVKPFNMKVAVEKNNYSYDKKSLDKVPAISKIKIDNSRFNIAGYEGLVFESEISGEGLEIPFNSFGAKNKENGDLVFAYDKKNPPIVTYKDYLGNIYTGNLEFYSMKEEGISLNVETGKFPRYESDKYFNVWIKEKDEELKKEVVLKAGKEYILVAIDGDRSKFTEWSFTDEGLNENFGEYFVGERKDKEITFKMTEELMKKFEDMKLETINVKGGFNAYNRVEVEIKGEKSLDHKIIQTNRRNISLNNITRYDENSSKYKIALESILKEEEYSHKIEDEKYGTIYLISKDNKGNVVKRFSDADGKNTLLLDNKLVNNNEKKVEFIAVPNVGQSFRGFQIKTEAMDIIESGDIKSKISSNPKESGFYLENKSPYIVIELNNMSRKHYSLKVDALFKDFNSNDKIIDIEKRSVEYIKGYTKKDGLFPAFLKVEYEGKEEKGVLPVIWEDMDMENLKAGKHNIQGYLNDPNFKDKVELEIHIKEIKEIKDREKSEVLLHPNIFDENFYASFDLPNVKKVILEIGEGKDEEQELDIKWKQVSYTKENNYRVRDNYFSGFTHGKYTVEGEVKGFPEKLIYNMEVIPGLNVSFREDDLFQYNAGDWYPYTTIFSENKKVGEIVEDIEVNKRNGYKFLGWYHGGSVSSNPLEIGNEIKQEFPKTISKKDLKDYKIYFRTKWQQVGVKEVSHIEVLKGSDLPKTINIKTTEDDSEEIEVLEWQKTEELKVGENTLIAKIHWGMEMDEDGHSLKRYKEEVVEVTVIVKDKVVEEKEFTIEFNSNGGTEIDSMIVKENQTISKPTDPTKEGYKFIGWYEDIELTREYGFSKPVEKNITLYAKWEKDAPIQEKLEIKSVELIEKEGRIISTGIIKDKAITLEIPKGYNEDLNIGQHILKITGTEKTRISQDRGYDGSIEEWTDGQVSNSIRIGESKKFTIYKGDKSVDYTIEILAEKEPTPPQEDEYTVIFNTNGGSKIKQIKVKRDEKISRPIDPTKENNKFIGWYEDSNFSNVFSFKTTIKEDITLYAKWEKIKINIESIPEIINEVKVGTPFELPKRVQVTMSDKSSKFIDVESWNPLTTNTSKVGTFNFEGNIKGTDKKVKLILTVKDDKAKDDTTKSFPRITRFSLLGYEASIDDENERIIVTLPYNINLRSLVPDITTVESNSISPSKGSAVNFNSTVNYTVYGEDNTKKTYRVIVDMPSERDSYYWDDNYKRRRDDHYDRRSRISWWELAEDAKERRERKEERTESAKDRRFVRKERYKILNDVGKIISSARNSRSSLMINENNNYIEIIPTIADFKSGFNNIITIPKDVLSDLPKGEYDFIKYSTGIVNIEIYPFMEAASGLKLNLCDVPRNIKDKWNKIKGKGYVFQVESSSTKGGLSYELNLEKLYPAEKLRFVKYDYMKGDFADLPPEKWYVFGGKLRCEKVSAGIYGIIYKD